MIPLHDLPRRAETALAQRLFGREHYIVFRDHPIVYARVPKAANSAIKNMLARALLTTPPERSASPDIFWKRDTFGETRMLRTREAARLPPEAHLIFTVVRSPLERLASFWDNKVHGEGTLPEIAARMGIAKTDSFARTIDIICDTPSHRMDVHVLPQADILLHRGRLVPSFLGRHETIIEDWARLREAVLARGARDIGPLRGRLKERGRTRQLDAYFGDPALLAKVKRRYEADFSRFYPHLL